MKRFAKPTQSIDRLTLRERLFLFAAAIVVVTGLWEAGLAAPLEARKKAAGGQLAAVHDRIEKLSESITAAANGMSEGLPGQLDRLRALRDRVSEGDDAVRVYTRDLVDPSEMRVVLEELMSRQSGLRLESATNLPPRALFEQQPSTDGAPTTATGVSDAPKLYRHGLVLKFEGSYLDCLAYLQAVERLPWHLYWTRFELAAGDYPSNEITIEVDTLSSEKEWIGV